MAFSWSWQLQKKRRREFMKMPKDDWWSLGKTAANEKIQSQHLLAVPIYRAPGRLATASQPRIVFARSQEMSSPVTKILLLGPIKVGKSAIATFLGEIGDWEATETYRPTKGVRIIDFETREDGGYRNIVEIELWDCSGDPKYKDCWAAMKDEIGGVILVADPDENSADDLLPWYSEFVQKPGIPNENVLVLLNEKGDRHTNQENIAAFKLIKDVRYLAFNLKHEGDILRENINAFITKIRSGRRGSVQDFE